MAKDLIQMQVIDNLLVIHNIDSRSTQLYDLKLEDWHIPLMHEDARVVEYGSIMKKNGSTKYLSECLAKDEKAYTEY